MRYWRLILTTAVISERFWPSLFERNGRIWPGSPTAGRMLNTFTFKATEGTVTVVMAPVSMDQIIEVCEQDRFMPPKSTWFEPKIRIGLCIALF